MEVIVSLETISKETCTCTFSRSRCCSLGILPLTPCPGHLLQGQVQGFSAVALGAGTGLICLRLCSIKSFFTGWFYEKDSPRQLLASFEAFASSGLPKGSGRSPIVYIRLGGGDSSGNKRRQLTDYRQLFESEFPMLSCSDQTKMAWKRAMHIQYQFQDLFQ